MTEFVEKPKGDEGLINAGYFVLNKKCIDYITDLQTTWEQEPLRQLAAAWELSAYYHPNFWQPMDTLRNKQKLNELWNTGHAPWKVWD